MSKTLNDILKEAYNLYKNESKPPIPLEIIKEFLDLEGIAVE